MNNSDDEDSDTTVPSNTDDEDSETITSDNSSLINANTTDLNNAVSEVNNLLNQHSSSLDATKLLIEKYEAVDDLLTDDEEVNINGKDLDSDKIENIIEDLEDNVKYQKNLNSAILAIINYYQNYLNSDNVTVKTSDQLEGELDLWNDLEDIINSDSVAVINGISYNSSSIDSKIDSLENEIDYLNDEDLVELTYNGTSSYISEDAYQARLELKNETAIASKLFVNANDTIEGVNIIIHELDLIKELIIQANVSSVNINGHWYTYDQLDDLVEQLQNYTVRLEHDELLDEISENIAQLLNVSNDYNTKDELQELLDTWNLLLDAMVEGDTVIVNNNAYTLADVEAEVKNLTARIHQLDSGTIEQATSNGPVVVTAKVVDSDSLTGDEFFDLISSSGSFTAGTPIISTSSVAVPVSTDTSEDSQTSTSFLQDIADPSLLRDSNEAPSELHSPSEEYTDGNTRYILFTTYISGTLGAGKVYAMTENNKSSASIVIEGLDYPAAVCFDKNHNFLYVVEEGNSELQGSISMYQISWNTEDSFKLANSVSVKVYQGLPSDCKVDGYGNLYFTDSQANLIGMIVYSDLYYYISSNKFTDLYVATNSDNHIGSPIGIEILDSKDIYFINNEDLTSSDTLITASTNVHSVNQFPVNVLTNDGPAKGIALTGQNIYYSLSSGDIKSYNINGKTTNTISSGFFNGFVGLCYGDGYIYITNNQAGELYSFSLEDRRNTQPKIIAYVQAITSCYCVNDYASWISGILSIFILLN